MLEVLYFGIATGARTMTGIAVLCWAAYLGYVPLEHTWAFWMGTLPSVIVFTLAALGEYVGDTRPNAPSRASLGPALARFAFGALVGAAAARSIDEPLAGGILTGWVGVAIGMWGGVWLRTRLARWIGHDLPVAIAESLLMILIACHGAHSLHIDIVSQDLHGMVASARQFFA